MSGHKSGEWRQRDRKVLWHPFTQHGLWEDEDFPVIERGEGLYLFDADGARYLDGVSSLWLNVHGHGRTEIDTAIRDQLERIAHSTFLGQSHPPGIELAEKLVEISPPGLDRVFFSDNGSTAMEIALKMAYQYWCQSDPPRPEKKYFIKLENAYHGDTIGSVSLGGIDLFHQTYRPLLFPTIAAPSTVCRPCRAGQERAKRCVSGSGCLAEMERVLQERAHEIAGVVIEPVVQGAAGMIVQPEGFVAGVAGLCRRYGVLLIADEVAVGFGRTGSMFACLSQGVSPDLMAVGKGLSGGYLPIAATLAKGEVFGKFLGPVHSEKTFFHGHSYTANQLGCAAALASLGIFEKENTVDNVKARARQAAEWLERIAALDHVAETRQAGLMIGIGLEQDPEGMVPYPAELMIGRRAALEARKRGLIIRPLGDVVVVMPPLCVSEGVLDQIMGITMESIGKVTE